MRKMRKIVFLVILVNFVMSQNSTSSDNKNSSVNSTEKSARYDNTDEETAKVLAEFEKRSDVMLCIGIFSRIPQDYIAKKVKQKVKFSFFFQKIFLIFFANFLGRRRYQIFVRKEYMEEHYDQIL